MSMRNRPLAFTSSSRTKVSATWEYDTASDEVRCSNPTAGAPGLNNGRGSGDFDRCRLGNGDRIQQHKQRLAGVPVGLAILKIPAALGTAGVAPGQEQTGSPESK